MKKTFLIILLSFYLNEIIAQSPINRDTTVYVWENGIKFKKAWVGGMNGVQFSEIDLNLDGILDLITFDRAGNKINPYISINNEYIFSPNYRQYFPKIHDWILLADYNCDGKKDIYTYSTGGIAIYKNISNSSLEFQLENPLILSDYGSNNINIFVSAIDIPAIVDVDYDGDLDILTFAILGGFVEYHRNMSIELKGNCDTIAYKYEDGCWGNFYEGLNSYILDCINCQCPSISTQNLNKQKHAGSTLLAIDVDNDNDKDLILGDIFYNNLNLLINGGDNDSAHMIFVDSVFPSNTNNTIATDISFFPAAFYIDIDYDGVKDLIVSPNSQNNAENFKSNWSYINNGQNNAPDFSFSQNNFIQNEMIDLGEGSYPVLFDYNLDGLLDIIVGNYGYYNLGGNPVSSIALFENVGTPEEPKFWLVDRDWQNISSINLNTGLNIPSLNLYPTFGDLDGDGYLDLIIGDADGRLHFFKNDGMIPPNFNITIPNFSQIDVGYFATPQLIDVNRDGLLDLLVGEQLGTINYLPNSGTQTVPLFDTIIENFGGIDVEDSIISTGYSTPKIIEINGNYHLFTGSYSGKIYEYNNIDNNLSGVFNQITTLSNNIWDGGKSALCIDDLNNDNNVDIVLGNYSGGLSLYTSDSSLINNTSNSTYNIDERLVKIIDVLGRNVKPNSNQTLFYIYNTGRVEKKIILNK